MATPSLAPAFYTGPFGAASTEYGTSTPTQAIQVPPSVAADLLDTGNWASEPAEAEPAAPTPSPQSGDSAKTPADAPASGESPKPGAPGIKE